MSDGTPAPHPTSPRRPLHRPLRRLLHRRGRRRGEDGQVGLLILGVCVLVLTLVIGIIDVTAVQLARVRLYDAADAAALDAADALAEEAAYRTGVSPRIPVTEDGVRDQAARYLAGSPRPAQLSTWALAAGTGTRDGHAATVVLTGVVEVPLGSALLGSIFGPVEISVTATAESRVGAAGMPGAAPGVAPEVAPDGPAGPGR